MTTETPVWEQSKENAAPLQRGRYIGTLEQAFADVNINDDAKLKQFEAVVSTSEGNNTCSVEDVLMHWIAYIKYVQESFPADTSAQFLLLERCFRALCTVDKYANDPRFIRVCCMYAEKTSRSSEIFKYMYTQKIGAEVAIFWAAWAFVAEKEKDFAFAEKIFDKAIRKEVKPLKYIMQRYKQFQRRMSRHWLNASTQHDLDEEATEQQPTRGALGGLTQEAVRRNDRSRPERVAMPRTRAPQRPAGNVETKFLVYRDENNEATTILDQSHSLHHERVLESDQDQRKENADRTERWNERGALATRSSLYVRLANPRSSGPAFAVYVDEECARQNEADEKAFHADFHRHRAVRDERTFRQRSEDRVVDHLASDPLRYVKNPSQLGADQENEKISASIPKVSLQSKKPKTLGYASQLLQNTNRVEQCFEEARCLAKYFTVVTGDDDFNHLAIVQATNDADSCMSIDASFGVASIDDSRLSQPPVSENLPLQPPLRSTPLAPNVSTSSSTVDAPNATGSRNAEPTINTQLAFKELSMMFSSPAFPSTEEKGRHGERTGGLPILNVSGVSETINDRNEEFISNGVPNSSFAVVDEPHEAPVSSFVIHCDENPPARNTSRFENQARDSTARPSSRFTLHCDDTSANDGEKAATKSRIPFAIYTDEAIEQENSPEQASEDDVGLSEDVVSSDQDSPSGSCGDTATFSVFNEIDQLDEK